MTNDPADRGRAATQSYPRLKKAAQTASTFGTILVVLGLLSIVGAPVTTLMSESARNTENTIRARSGGANETDAEFEMRTQRGERSPWIMCGFGVIFAGGGLTMRLFAAVTEAIVDVAIGRAP